MRKSKSSTGSRLIRAGIATGAVAAIVVAGAPTPAVAATALTLSATTGPTGSSTTTITGTSTTAFLTTSQTAPVATFSQAACLNAYATSVAATTAPSTANTGNVPVPAANLKKLSNNKIAITVPSAVVAVGSPQAPTKYNVCLYPSATVGAVLAASATYTAALAPTITAVTPGAGPALGGNVISVSGLNIPTTGTITATLGGIPLTGITGITATGFNAIAPAHSAEDNVTLQVVTSAGTAILRNAYDYTNSIDIAPNTAPNTATAVDIDVMGTGFLTPTFGSGTSNAHVYLVDGAYESATNGTNRANGPIAECGNVLVVSDIELICTMALNQRLNAAGNLTLPAARTITTDISTTDGSPVITSAGAANFSALDVGVPITESGNTNIPAGTTIVSVLSPTRAVLSAEALATAGSAITVSVGGPLRSVASVVTNTTAGTANTVTAPASSFTTADIGRPIVGTGIPAGTTITAIAAGGAGATLSNAATAAGTISGAVHAAAPVPNGAYTLTVVSNGSLNAATTDTDYSQTIVSSDATFTVAPF